MGTWGAGNFQNDCAMDYAGRLVRGFVEDVEYAAAEPSRMETDEFYGDIMPCLVAIISSLHELTGTAAIPRPNVVAGWKAKYMAVWEGYIDKLRPAPGYKEQRRAVLLETFDRLEQQSRQIHRTGG
jgi:hypothetical protein